MEEGEYDAYAEAYAWIVAEREAGGPAGDPFGILPVMLELLGDVRGRRVLDAGCGTGYLARALAALGARVTGIDVSPRLIELARRQDPAGAITYRVADLSRPLSDRRYHAIGSHLVIEDVEGYRGFAATLSGLLKPGGRLVLALNNPYSAVAYGRVDDYFASGAISPYRGLWAAGVRTHYRHRTLAEYLDAFLATGLALHRLVDVPSPRGNRTEGDLRLPRFMVLAFTAPARR